MRARVVLTACLVLGSLGGPQDARAVHEYDADPVQVRFEAPVPCAVLCPYWTDTDEATCRPDPPSISGSWDDHDLVLDPPPMPEGRHQTSVFLVFHIRPAVDFDSWICRQLPDSKGRYHLVTGGPSFDCGVASSGIGCEEWPELSVCMNVTWPDESNWCVPRGTPIRLRVYNWSDPTLAVDGEYYYSLKGKV